ncbi:phage holin family protein [Cellulomonas citrea]|uniref:phage holin family protein n=1 Tax=Cellulomonas citrea TaxID=1909423 RepID=UPI0013579FF9|nr:phage holin family protein [Cellulomonas citrea]
MAFIVRVIISGVAIWFATLVLPGVAVKGASTTAQEVGVYLLVGLVFGIVNAVVKPVVQVLSIPLYILTLGLFTLVVNALMLLLTAWITSATHWGLTIDNFGSAVLAALIVSVVSFALSAMVPASRSDS